MTVNAAFTNRTTDGVSTSFALATEKATVQVEADSVMNGARIEIELCSVNTDAKFTSAGEGAVIFSPGVRVVTAPAGHFIRLRQAGSVSGTSINATITT